MKAGPRVRLGRSVPGTRPRLPVGSGRFETAGQCRIPAVHRMKPKAWRRNAALPMNTESVRATKASSLGILQAGKYAVRQARPEPAGAGRSGIPGPRPNRTTKIGALTSQSNRRGELRPHRLDFDGLVHERVADAECRGLKRKALIAAADFDPVRLSAAGRRIPQYRRSCESGGRIYRSHFSACRTIRTRVHRATSGPSGCPWLRCTGRLRVRTAAAPLKRIQLLSSLTNAGSAIWALLACTT